MDLQQHLSKRDLFTLLETANASLLCKDLEQFETIVLNLQNILQFEHAFCTALNTHEIIPLKVVDMNYPEEFLKRYFEQEYYLNDHVVDELLTSFDIQHWKTVDKKYQSLEKREAATVEAIDFGLRDGFSYGTLDADEKIGTCFSFAGKAIENNERSRAIISYAIPHLAEALKRIFYTEKNDPAVKITKREREILHWLKEGKTSWEVSVILGIKERTVNFHIANAKKKLNATTRSQVIAMAIVKGEIEL